MIFAEIEQALKAAAKDKANEIAHGNAETFSQYKMECGIIAGLNMAVYICEDIIRRHVDDVVENSTRPIDLETLEK